MTFEKLRNLRMEFWVLDQGLGCEYWNTVGIRIANIQITETFELQTFENLLFEWSQPLNNGPFRDRTVLDHSNTELICYSDPHCTGIL